MPEGKMIDPTIKDKEINGLKVFGIIMAIILLFIAKLQTKIKHNSYIKERSQNSNLEGESNSE